MRVDHRCAVRAGDREQVVERRVRRVRDVEQRAVREDVLRETLARVGEPARSRGARRVLARPAERVRVTVHEGDEARAARDPRIDRVRIVGEAVRALEGKPRFDAERAGRGAKCFVRRRVSLAGARRIHLVRVRHVERREDHCDPAAREPRGARLKRIELHVPKAELEWNVDVQIDDARTRRHGRDGRGDLPRASEREREREKERASHSKS